MNASPDPAPATLEELRKVPVLQGLSEEVVEWLLEHSSVREFADGEVVMRTGDPTEELWLILDGRMDFYMDLKGRLILWYTFSHDPPSLGASGLLPYSRMQTSPGWAYARGPVRLVRLHKATFRELERVSPELVQRLIATMTERARYFATRKLQEEKISALGKLAAGLAHELNNPAAAIQRTATELATRLSRNYDLTSVLLERDIPAEALRRIRDLVGRGDGEGRPARETLMERMTFEDTLSARLVEMGVPDAEAIAEALADAGVDPQDLEEIRHAVAPEQVPPLIGWLGNILVSGRVIQELEDAASRISHLVSAMKSHVYMDRSVMRQPVDVHRGLDDTLTILNHRLREKGISVERDYETTLPHVLGFGGELNQVWTNLIDNAIDAVGQAGRIGVATSRDGDRVKVVVSDDGAGIPAEIQSQVFDPFFTTKKQGEGTGMGLDIVRQALDHHRGEVRLFSEPGRTEFHVLLPVAPDANLGNEMGEAVP